MKQNRFWFLVYSFVLLVQSFTLPAFAQLGTESVTIKSPNGGECFIPGSQVYIAWEGTGYDHVAIGYRTDANQPPTWGLDYRAWDVHWASGTTFKWTVPNITSNSVRLWIEAHNANHARVALDSSNNVFTISNICDVGDPPSTTAPQVSQILVKGSIYKTSDTIEVERGTDLTIVGTAGSSERVTLYVKSEEKTFFVTAGQDGKWTFDLFTKNLADGSHQVDLETVGSVRTKAFTFTVIPLGQRPSVLPPPPTSSPPLPTEKDGSVERTDEAFPYVPLAYALGAALIAGIVAHIIIRRRGKRIDQTPAEPPTLA